MCSILCFELCSLLVSSLGLLSSRFSYARILETLNLFSRLLSTWTSLVISVIMSPRIPVTIISICISLTVLFINSSIISNFLCVSI